MGAIRCLGEVALRVRDLQQMQTFYELVLGLAVLRRSDDAVFFKVADGFGGHTQSVVLFQHDSPPRAVEHSADTTLDHIAFAIAQEDFESERQRLESLGLRVELAEHAWVHWRSLYINDPEGNRVELVCYDERVQ